MKVSVFTPSHNVKWLDECYESLQEQTYQDWEWIVLLNGDNNIIWQCDDDRVKIIFTDSTGIGKLKKEACSLCNGEFLLELDHDDRLTSDCLEKVVKAFEENPDAGFVYSCTAQISENGERNDTMFNPAMGWTYEETEKDGKNYLKCNRMPHYPSTVSYIWFAPNHVRAFRKSVYDQINGYSEDYEVLDDLDIICRMYQAADFYSIDDVLYLQRVHPDNTQVRPDLNARIQVETVSLYDIHVQNNAKAWANRNGLMLLDLGSAHNPAPGYTTTDLEGNVDLPGDIFEVLGSLPDNSVGVIRAVDFLEHIPDKIRLFNEMYRVLAHGGMLLSLTPSTDGRGAFQDPTHVAFYNENSFWYFTDINYAKFVPSIKSKFMSSRLQTIYMSEWHVENKLPYVMANLVAIKDGPRIAGELKW